MDTLPGLSGIYGLKDGGLIFGPHMKRKPIKYARGGRVGYARGGLMASTIDNETGEVMGPGTETSDSIPATVNDQEPARLSDGEFVMSAAAVDLSGQEILSAINDAGLRKRGDVGQAADTPMPQQGYRRGGRITRSCASYGLE